MKINSTLLSTVTFLFLSLSTTLMANPIGDNSYVGYKAGWFPSTNVPCNAVCENAYNGQAEHEALNLSRSRNKLTYVCRSKTALARQGKGWLYGNNFSSPAHNKICLVSSPQGDVLQVNQFMCLCVDGDAGPNELGSCTRKSTGVCSDGFISCGPLYTYSSKPCPTE